MNRMMIDFETFGLSHNVLPFSVGVVVFNLEGIVHQYYANFDCRKLLSVCPNSFQIEYGTVHWWMQQSQEARDRIFGETALRQNAVDISVDIALAWEHYKCQELWANGADFDGAILKNLRNAFGHSQFWPYNALRDARTVYKLFPNVVQSIKADGVKHDALSDAIWQTKALIKCLQIIEGSELPNGV